jgi:hypothetical protein
MSNDLAPFDLLRGTGMSGFVQPSYKGGGLARGGNRPLARPNRTTNILTRGGEGQTTVIHQMTVNRNTYNLNYRHSTRRTAHYHQRSGGTGQLMALVVALLLVTALFLCGAGAVLALNAVSMGL